jgi:PTS system mannose-specific IIA component
VIGIVVVTHYRLADELLQAVRLICGDVPHIRGIGLDPSMSPDEMREGISKRIQEVNAGEGVLVMVDMFGGTPSNMCLAFLDEGRVEVVTGLNLPMLVRAAQARAGEPLHTLAERVRDAGRAHISVASDVLAGRERFGGADR